MQASPSQQHDSFFKSVRLVATRNFTILALLNFINAVIYFQLFVITTPYVQETFGASLSQAGFAASIIILGNFIGRFFSGNLLSRYGFYPILWASLLLYNLCFVIALFTTSLTGMYIQRIASGAALGLSLTAYATMIAKITPPEHRGLAIGIFSLGSSLSLAMGPMLGIFMMRYFSYKGALNLSLILGSIAIILALALRNLPKLDKKNLPFFHLSSYIDYRVVRFALVTMFICMCYGCVQVFIIPYTTERGLTTVSSFFFLAFAITTVLTRPISGHLYDRHGEKALMYPLILLTILTNVLLAYSHSGITFLLAGAVLGLGFGNFQSIGHSISLSLVDGSRFAQATTTFFASFEIAMGFSPSLIGLLVPQAGYKGAFLMLAFLVFVSMLLYWFDRGRKII